MTKGCVVVTNCCSIDRRDRRDRRIGSGRIQISHGDHRGHYDRDYSSDTKWYNRDREDHRYDRHADKGRDMGRVSTCTDVTGLIHDRWG